MYMSSIDEISFIALTYPILIISSARRLHLTIEQYYFIVIVTARCL